MGYSWPGNVRELENLIQRTLVMLEKPEIDVTDLDFHSHRASPRPPADGLLTGALDSQLTLREFTDVYMAETLKRTRGNKVQAARRLGINPRTMYRRGPSA